MKTKVILENEEFFKEVIELLNQDKKVSLMVKGTSMKPFFDESTEVFLEKQGRYSKRDICLFRFKDKYLLHRLIKINQDKYVFRGDNLISKEEVSEDKIFGKVIYYIKNDRQFEVKGLISSVRLLNHRLFLRFKVLLRKIIRRK